MNSRALQRLIFSIVLLCNLGFAGPSAAAVSLRATTQVNRPTVRLSDVFDGLPDGIDCDIARAPAPGKSITYDSNVLAHLVREYKLDWKLQDPSDHTTITTAGVKITADDIRAAVIGKVKALGTDGDIDVTFDNRMLEVVLPADRPPDFALNNFSFDAVSKRFHADMVADNFAGPMTLPVMGHIAVRHNVPVFTKRLDAGTVIGAADLDWISVSEDRLAGAITSADDLIGQELKRDTDGGQPIRQCDIMPPRFVVRGSLVTMKIETPFMTVTSQGRALQDGKLGDTVRVTNTQSNRMVEGTVESAGVVRIHTTQKLASVDALQGQE